MKTPRFLFLSATLVAFLGACAGDTYIAPEPEDTGLPGRDATTEEDTVEEDVVEDVEVPIEEGAWLELMAEPELTVRFDSSIDLPVRLLDGENNPIEGVRLRYELGGANPDGASLAAMTSTTGEDGMGVVALRGGSSAASLTATISVPGQDDIEPVQYAIDVQPKNAADYIVRVHYDGPLVGLEVDVLLYTDQPRLCTDLVADPASPDNPSAYLSERVSQSAVDGTFRDLGIEMHSGEFPVYYAVAFATKEDQTVGYACTHGLPVDVELGEQVIIDMDLYNLYPEVEGNYEIDNLFDLIEGVPDAYEPYVRYLGEFFQAPGSAIVSILEDNWEDFADLPSWARDAVGSIIDALLEEYLPPEAQIVFQVGGDLYTALSEFNADGTLVITANADRDGMLADNNTLTLTTFEFEFDGTPYRRDLRDYGYSAAEGTWSGHLGFQDGSFGYTINIDPFSLTLNYGEILLFAMESIVFPEFIDPSVTRFEDFVTWLIDCHDLAVAVDEDPGFIQNTVESVCDLALDFLGPYLRDLITSQSADIGSYFELSADSCAMTDLDNPEDFRIDTLGTHTNECAWGGTIRVDGDSPETGNMNATFHATR